MAFLKKHLLIIALALGSLGSVGLAGWGYLAGEDILQRMQAIDQLKREVVSSRSNAANLETIETRKKQIEQQNAELEQSLAAALAKQKNNAFTQKPRELLNPDALPNPKSPAAKIDFKDKYQREFNRMLAKLRGRDRATHQEINDQEAIIENKHRPAPQNVDNPWRTVSDTTEEKQNNGQQRSLRDILREYPKARAAEFVARSIYMYVDKHAIRPNRKLRSEDIPNTVLIWQAQMSLWIQQDIVEALARVNQQRADKLIADGRVEDVWVAHMPIKRLKILRIRGWLGRGGGSNQGRFTLSFTDFKNDKTKFIIPLQMDLVVEEASVIKVIESLSGIGFYTPLRVSYRKLNPNPLQDKYIYGEDPVVLMTIDLEAYYFRKVFENWIPKPLKKILQTPQADEPVGGRR